MKKNMKSMRLLAGAAGFAAVALTSASSALAAGAPVHIEPQKWSFSGVFGTYDREQLRRGYQIYADTCSACHSLKLLHYRNLGEKGGPEFPESKVKEIAAEAEIVDGPNDEGEMFERPGKPFDRFKAPFENKAAARAANNGAYPPDLSVITKARNVHGNYWWFAAPFVWLKDMATGYQEGGADYVYAFLTGYTEPPKWVKLPDGNWRKVEKGRAPADAVSCVSASKETGCVKLADGMNYNKAFPGHQTAMPPQVDSPEQARDVVAFLMWAAEPHLEARKMLGFRVLLYLAVLAGLLYFVKQRVWSNVRH